MARAGTIARRIGAEAQVVVRCAGAITHLVISASYGAVEGGVRPRDGQIDEKAQERRVAAGVIGTEADVGALAPPGELASLYEACVAVEGGARPRHGRIHEKQRGPTADRIGTEAQVGFRIVTRPPTPVVLYGCDGSVQNTGRLHSLVSETHGAAESVVHAAQPRVGVREAQWWQRRGAVRSVDRDRVQREVPRRPAAPGVAGVAINRVVEREAVSPD